ncbi:hypothetical protein [Liquorilactobacillus cacaonum]|uniref:DUF4649 domain-containing protein n=1 Tax=Liquorilactobacillus cacaonum DSM 21116 TaxID=1423729 RepID=A0A0R2CRC1_9LACO|nr:hypothetical protein [Liquorilactobacillus cacaonum]KRM90843.1 hypothetical protein FC80_GL000837 [Liquorilactobacillus cacaonum DSM 21116]
MLKIYYTADGDHHTMEFKNSDAFVANLQLEVPALQDHYTVQKVTIDDKEDTGFTGKTVVDLYNYYA